MADYINRSDLHDYLRSGRYGDRVNNSEIHAAINKIPSADVVEVKHGDWKWRNGGECSECGFHNSNFDYNFCPNCGAKMDGGT